MKDSLAFESQFLGSIRYGDALALQEKLRDDLARNYLDGQEVTHHLLGLEHPSVITLGKRADIGREVRNAGDTEVVRVHRGGLATLHNSGQLVIYPVFHLQSLGVGVRDWVTVLLQTTAETLRNLAVEASAKFDPAGVYTLSGKIAFVGVQVRRGVSTHGLSININNDLSEFSKIQSCGLSEAPLDSVGRHLVDLGTKDFFEKWSVVFLKNLWQIKTSLNTGLVSESDRVCPAGGGISSPHDGD